MNAKSITQSPTIKRLWVGKRYLYTININDNNYYLDMYNYPELTQLKTRLRRKGFEPFKIKGLITHD